MPAPALLPSPKKLVPGRGAFRLRHRGPNRASRRAPVKAISSRRARFNRRSVERTGLFLPIETHRRAGRISAPASSFCVARATATATDLHFPEPRPSRWRGRGGAPIRRREPHPTAPPVFPACENRGRARPRASRTSSRYLARQGSDTRRRSRVSSTSWSVSS